MLACRKYSLKYWGICILLLASVLVPGCKTGPASSPIGLWKSTGYPATRAPKPILLEIRANGEYFYNTLQGRGTWKFQNGILVLNAFPGAMREELMLESRPRMLRNTLTDGVDFVPFSGDPSGPTN